MVKKAIHTSGKRKRAVARATLKEGTGNVMINNSALGNLTPRMYQLRIMEPLILSGIADKVDISVAVHGGGISSQADAIRLAIARALTLFKPALEEIFNGYDRHLLVADVRRKEAAKPNRHGKARAKKQKSYR